MPAFGQSMLNVLSKYQGTLSDSIPQAQKGKTNSSLSVKPSGLTSTSSAAQCTENDQTSVPMAYISSLILEANGALDIEHDPRSSMLKISSPDLIGNCSSMLEWNLNRPELDGKKSYAIEVKIKDEGNCPVDGCTYKVAKVKNKQFDTYEDMVFKPTLKGFEECLKKSGVVVDGKVVPEAIYPSPVRETFSGLDYSGQIQLKSRGPSSKMIGPKYGKFTYIDGCDHYEAIHPDINNLLTLEDSEKIRLNAEAEKLKGCKTDEYHKLTDFIEKYQGYSDELAEVRNKLILEAAKKSAEALTNNKFTDEDLKVAADFETYIVNPKVDLAVKLYEESLLLEGDEKKNKQAELKLVLAEIKALNNKPYFLSTHVDKLLEAGKFDEAEQINGFKLVLQNYQSLGSKINNVVISSDVASKKVATSRTEFSESMPSIKEKYNYKTGQESGKAMYYTRLANSVRVMTKLRTDNYTAEIQEEYQRVVQPNGYCYKFFRNTQKCIRETFERIQELQQLLTHYNKVDEERAIEYEADAKEYTDLENQGRRYLAAQNGEAAPADVTPQASPTTSPTSPPPRVASQDGVYNFDYQGQQGQQGQQQYPQQQMYPQQQQMYPQGYNQQYGGQYQMNYSQNQGMFQQQNPYQAQPQYNPWLGQQSYPSFQQQGGAGYNFSWGGNMGMGQQQQPYGGYQQPYAQPQQQGYWGSPYQSYNMYSMYGPRT